MRPTHRFLAEDHEFYLDDVDERATDRIDELLDDGFLGVAIDVPFEVDTGTHATLPVLGVFARPADQRANFTDNAMVVVMDPAGLGFLVEPALRSEQAEDEEDFSEGTGVVAEPFMFDARECVPGLPWGRGRVRLYVVHQGDVSDGIAVEFSGADFGPLSSPELLQSIAGAPAPDPDGSLLRAPDKATTQPGATVLLSGTVPEDSSQVVHLLALGPAPSPFSIAVQPAADGSFAVNMLGDNALPKAPGTWHLYAFSGDAVHGPVTIELEAGSEPW